MTNKIPVRVFTQIRRKLEQTNGISDAIIYRKSNCIEFNVSPKKNNLDEQIMEIIQETQKGFSKIPVNIDYIKPDVLNNTGLRKIRIYNNEST